METNLNNNFEALFSKLEGFVSSKTIVGEAITMGDVIILPLVDISFGLAAGAVEVSTGESKKGDTGGGGAGASITPTAVLVVTGGTVQLVHVKNQDSLSKIIDMAPGLLTKLNGLFKRGDETKADVPAEKPAEEMPE